jgi:MFS family permease
MRSVWAVFLGVVLAWLVAALVAVGIVAPVFTGILGDRAGSAALPLVVFVAAFAFYFGGMYSAYKAPSHHRVHGVAVGVVSFLVSPALNLLAGGSFAPLREPVFLGLTGVALVVVLAASYIGALRGESLQAHNARVLRDRARRAALAEEQRAREEGARTP